MNISLEELKEAGKRRLANTKLVHGLHALLPSGTERELAIKVIGRAVEEGIDITDAFYELEDEGLI